MKRIAFISFLVLLILALASCSGKNDPAAQPTPEGGFDPTDVAYSEAQGMELDAETGRDKYLTDPVPEGMPLPVEPENAVVTKEELHCTLSISCGAGGRLDLGTHRCDVFRGRIRISGIEAHL